MSTDTPSTELESIRPLFRVHVLSADDITCRPELAVFEVGDILEIKEVHVNGFCDRYGVPVASVAVWQHTSNRVFNRPNLWRSYANPKTGVITMKRRAAILEPNQAEADFERNDYDTARDPAPVTPDHSPAQIIDPGEWAAALEGTGDCLICGEMADEQCLLGTWEARYLDAADPRYFLVPAGASMREIAQTRVLGAIPQSWRDNPHYMEERHAPIPRDLSDTPIWLPATTVPTANAIAGRQATIDAEVANANIHETPHTGGVISNAEQMAVTEDPPPSIMPRDLLKNGLNAVTLDPNVTLARTDPMPAEGPGQPLVVEAAWSDHRANCIYQLRHGDELTVRNPEATALGEAVRLIRRQATEQASEDWVYFLEPGYQITFVHPSTEYHAPQLPIPEDRLHISTSKSVQTPDAIRKAVVDVPPPITAESHEPTQMPSPPALSGQSLESPESPKGARFVAFAADPASKTHVDTGPMPSAPNPVFNPTLEKRICIIGFTDHWRFAPLAGQNDGKTWSIWMMNNFHKQIPEQAWRQATEWFNLHPFELVAQDDEHLKWAQEQCAVPYYMFEETDQIAHARVFPQDAALSVAGHNYFTNSVSWMLALAIHRLAPQLERYKTRARELLAVLHAAQEDVHNVSQTQHAPRLLEEVNAVQQDAQRALQAWQDDEQPVIGVYGVDMAVQTEYGAQRPSCEYFIGVAEGLGFKVQMPTQTDLLAASHLYGTGTDQFRATLESRSEIGGRRIQEAAQKINALQAQHRQAELEHAQLVGAAQERGYFLNVWTQPAIERGNPTNGS